MQTFLNWWFRKSPFRQTHWTKYTKHKDLNYHQEKGYISIVSIWRSVFMQLINRSVILFLKPWKNKIISSTSTSRLSAASLHFSARQRKSEKGERLPKARGGGDGEASEAKNRERLDFSWSPPTTLSSLLFRVGAQFSYDSLRSFNDWIKIREYLIRS